MASVTQRVAEIKQPYGGYLPMKQFQKIPFHDEYTLNENENISPALVGLAVDYLTRFMMGDSVEDSFHISWLGAYNIRMEKKWRTLISNITGLDDISISSACKLSGFDVCYRSSASAYRPIEEINPDQATIENIRIMVNRCIAFWKVYGPIVCSELTFEGGYTKTVHAGDGDFLTQYTLWDFKVSKSAPTSKHSLQILMYYIMGLHSKHDHYKQISNLGFFNPRLHIAYVCPIETISQETISIVEVDVIGYGNRNDLNEMPVSEHACGDTIKEEYSVADICEMTGQKRSRVLSDIHNGFLEAFKKGRKYVISADACEKYIRHIEIQQRITLGICLVFAAIALICMFVIMSLC